MTVREIAGMLRMQADGILQHRTWDPLRRRLQRGQAIGPTDTAAEHREAAMAEMIHQRQVVCGISVPAVLCPDRGQGAAGIPLVHGNGGKAGSGKGRRPIHPGTRRSALRGLPHGDARTQSPGREQQHWKAAAMHLVMDMPIWALQHRHARVLLRPFGAARGLAVNWATRASGTASRCEEAVLGCDKLV